MRGIEHVRIGVGVVDQLRHGRAAEVFQQQEAGVDVARQHLRHAHAAGVEQVAHAQPGAHVFPVRRRVHHDPRRHGADGCASSCGSRRRWRRVRARHRHFPARGGPIAGGGWRGRRLRGCSWAKGKLPLRFQRGRYGEVAARVVVRRLRHPPVAALARGLSEAVPAAGRRRHHAAGDLAAGGRHCRCRADRRGRRRPPLPGRRTAAPDRRADPGDLAGAAGPQHRAGDRRRCAAGAGRGRGSAAAGAAVRPCGARWPSVPRRRAAWRCRRRRQARW